MTKELVETARAAFQNNTFVNKLADEIERLQSIALIANEYGIQGFVDIEELRKENERLTKQRDDLVAALKKFGEHLHTCDCVVDGEIMDGCDDENDVCTCGFSSAIAGGSVSHSSIGVGETAGSVTQLATNDEIAALFNGMSFPVEVKHKGSCRIDDITEVINSASNEAAFILGYRANTTPQPAQDAEVGREAAKRLRSLLAEAVTIRSNLVQWPFPGCDKSTKEREDWWRRVTAELATDAAIQAKGG